jgi:hypothetical protein
VTGIGDLKRLLAGSPARAGERCEFCATAIAEPHSHVVNVVERTVLCVCRPCGLLFASAGAAGGHFRLVPERCVALAGAGGPAWDLLEIPVGVAFFFFNSALQRIAVMYPSPAGAIESTVPLDAWTDMVAAAPVLQSLEPDVEALLVRRTRGHDESFVVPIDLCYELVGLVRRHWKGFDGGEDAAREIDRFFARVGARCPVQAAASS